MRILHTEASCGWGGQEIRILEEASGLIARGHEVSVACPPHARLYSEAGRFGVPVVSMPIEFKTRAGFFALRDYLSRHPFDVVNTHSSADSWLTGLACATLQRAPAIVRTRHISAPVSGNLFNRWLYRRAARVVTTGESLRLQLLRALRLEPGRVVSVPTGIDTQRFAPTDKAVAKLALGLDPVRRYIGIVATLRSWKGHAYLLDAFSRLEHADLHLLIVGDGPQLPAIREKIAALGIDARATLAGQQINPEMWLGAMDVFCLPSYANEGVPQALVQAMMCGLAIVTTPVGAILEAVTDSQSALVVPPRNVPALAAAIGRLLDDPVLGKQLGIVARAEAELRFSKVAMLDRMEDVFRGALRSSRPTSAIEAPPS
jgi:glycosyltransferase involved in cell wall biosynthesis